MFEALLFFRCGVNRARRKRETHCNYKISLHRSPPWPEILLQTLRFVRIRDWTNFTGGPNRERCSRCITFQIEYFRPPKGMNCQNNSVFLQDNPRRRQGACLFICTQLRNLFAQRLSVVRPANRENAYLLLIEFAPAPKWQRLSGRKQIEVRIHGDGFLHLAAMTCTVQD